MIGYSEVIQTMAAMIIFSMILMNANRMMHRNTVMQVEGELEQEVIALGQEIIEESRTKSFDEITVGATAPPADIPGDFTATASLGPDSETSRRYYDDFDDYNNHTEVAQTAHGDFNISVEVYYVDEINYQKTSSQTTFKKIDVSIVSEFLQNNAGEPRQYTLEFIRNYYAD